MFSRHAPKGGRNRRAVSLRPTFRAGGARRKLLASLILLAFFIAFLPVLVSKTPLRNALLSAALRSNDIRISIGDASLSWFSGPSLSQVHIKTAAGDTILTADAATMDRSPLQLLLNSHDLGAIHIVRPTIHLKIRPDGSNLEDVLQQFLTDVLTNEPAEPDDGGATSPLKFDLHITEGTISAEDLAMNRSWRIEKLNIQYNAHTARVGPGSGSLSAQIIETSTGAGNTALAGRIAASVDASNSRHKVSWQTDGLPLAIAEPWLRRFIIAAELSGTLSTHGSATWTDATQLFGDFETSGYVTIGGLNASAPVLQGDRLKLVHVELPWRVAAKPAGLSIDDLQLRTDVGRAGLRGTIDPVAFRSATRLADAVSNSDLKHNVEFRGSLDLARLAAMFPRALKIRADTIITSGTIDAAAKCEPLGDGQAITGTVTTSQLAATSAGRHLQWNQPVLANVRLSRDKAATRLDSLACQSDFLQVVASGTPQKFSASANFDLNRLAQQLGQFVDLRRIELAGTGNAELNWKQEASHQFSARAAGGLSQLRVALSDGAIWDEPQLEILATAQGRFDQASHHLTQIDVAEINIAAQPDKLVAQLAGPVSVSDPAAVWAASIQASGGIARWLTRVRPWFSIGNWQIAGDGELTAKLRVAGQSFEAVDAAISATNLRAANDTWNVQEQRVEIKGDLRWNAERGTFAANSAQFVSSTVSLAVKDLQYRAAHAAAPHEVGQLSGVAAFRADLARLASWRAESADAADFQPQGALTGNVRFVEQNGRMIGEVTASGENLALLQRSDISRAVGVPELEKIWHEPKASLRGLIAYDATIDQLQFEQLQFQSNTLQAAASGRVEQISSAANANVSGTLNYDLAQLTPLLRPYLGKGIQFVGREQARFALAGQMRSMDKLTAQPVSLSTHSAIRNPQSPIGAHWSRRVRAQLEMPWSGANVYGLPVGPGRLAATLGEGAVRIEPLSLSVGEGQLTATPLGRLDPPPPELVLPAGPLITNVRISPEVSDAMLKYFAPVLAGATQSEGLFSMQLDGARVPLGEPKRVDSTGKLTVHSVRVVPGAMVREWITLAQQIEAVAKRRDPQALSAKPPVTLLSVRDQQVNFRVLDGRVHHQNMEFQVGDIVMRSQGSVGLDETLSLVLHVPIQDTWVAKEPLLAGLKGQSLQVPISGTLARPQMDPRAVANLSQQLLQSAAGEAIGNELNKALDKLFKSR